MADPSKIRGLPNIGDTLAWTGPTQRHSDSLQAVLRATDWPGVLHPRRSVNDLLSVLDPETRAVKPGLSLLLEDILLLVNWRNPQVFVARVTQGPPPAAATETGATIAGQKARRGVLKLIYYDTRQKGANVDLRSRAWLADPILSKIIAAEADAYAALEQCQGSLVPYCYGFYEFRLPNGDTTIGQVLEYVQGLPPNFYLGPGFLREGFSDDKIDAFLTNLYRTLIEFHKVGVLHKDQASRNCRLAYPLDPLNPSFVFFDFGMAVQAKDWQPSDESPFLTETHWLEMDEKRLQMFFDAGGPSFVAAVKKWQASARGAKLIRRWKTHPDDLMEEERVHDYYDAAGKEVKARL